MKYYNRFTRRPSFLRAIRMRAISYRAVAAGLLVFSLLHAKNVLEAKPSHSMHAGSSFTGVSLAEDGSNSQGPQVHEFANISDEQVAAILHKKMKGFAPQRTEQIATHLIRLCQKYRIDPAFALSVIQVESGFKADAKSPVGAIGLMQLMPATAQHIAKQNKIAFRGAASLKTPETNLTFGMAYLYYLREKYRGLSAYHHLAAYNVGPARLDELLARKNFRPTQTKKYYESIVKGIEPMRALASAK